MGGLLETQIEGDFFDRLAGEKQLRGGGNALFVKPVLRRASEVHAKLALQLPRG